MKILSLILMRTNYIRLTIRVLKKLKKKLNDVSMRLNANLKIHMGLKTRMILCANMIKK